MSEVMGVLFAIFVGMLIIPKLAEYQQTNIDNTRIAMTAQQQKQLTAAATTFIGQNALAYQGLATSTVPETITIATLQLPAVNLLPPTFSNTNPYGQEWQIEVLQPTAGNLQSLVTSKGGTALTDKQAVKVATLVSALGINAGIIPLNDSGIYPGGAANVYSANSSLSIPTTGYSNIAGGHPASIISFNNGQLQSNYLYRNAVPGQPQLNTLNTPLILGAGTVHASADACAAADLGALGRDAAGLVLMCNGTSWAKQGSLVVGGTCPAGQVAQGSVPDTGAPICVPDYTIPLAAETAARIAGDNALQAGIDTAQATATTAINNAAGAQTTATTAINNAAGAQFTANTAINNATTALNTANTAINNAAGAQNTANTALARNIFTNYWITQKDINLVVETGCYSRNPNTVDCSCLSGQTARYFDQTLADNWIARSPTTWTYNANYQTAMAIATCN